MNDQEKTREQLIAELDDLRGQIAGEPALPELRRAAALLQVTPVGIHECDTDGRITFVNPSQEAITGFTADEMVGTYIWDRIAPGPEKDSLPTLFKQLLSEQPAPTPFFAKNIRKSGEVFDARVDWNYIRNAEGEVTGFISVVSDITEQKQAESSALQAKEFNERLIASMGDGFSILDTDGVHVEVNAAFCRMTGFDRDELIGIGPPHPYWPPEHRDHIQQALDVVTRGEVQQLELTFIRKSGERFPVIVAPSRMTNSDGTVNYFATVKDISERKRAEKELQESERRLSTLMSNLPGMAYRCENDPNWTMKFVSQGAEKLTGYRTTDFIDNKKVPFGDLIHEDDRGFLWDQTQDALAKHLRYQFEYRTHTASGEERWVWEQGCGVYSEDGELQALEGFITDITPRKHAELELHKAHAELEQRVEERTAELTKANDELRIFKTFADASGEGFGMSDMDGKIVYGNAALARLVGEAKPQDAYGKHPSIYYSDDYQSLQETAVFPVLESDGVWQGELTMVSVTGDRIPVLQTSFTLLDDDGEAIRRGVVITDLRKIKETQMALQESLEELQAIYNGMMDGFNIFDMDSLKTIRANPALCDMLGYTEDELRALPVEKAHPAEDLPWILKRAEVHAEGRESRSNDIPLMRRDGSVFYTDVSSNPIRHKGRRCVLTFFHDITDRRTVEEELRKSEAKYKALVESSPDAIVMCDLQGQITFASPQAAERHGIEDASDLIGRSATDLVVERERELMKLNIHHLLESGLRRNDQYTGLRKNETTFFAEVSGAVIRDATGEPESFMAVYRDITERKEAQDALQKEQGALRRMLQASDRERELITYDIHDGVAQQVVGALMHFEAVSHLGGGVARNAMPGFETGLNALRMASEEARHLMKRTRTPVLSELGIRPAIADFIDQFIDRPNAPEITYHCEANFGRLEPILENTIFRVIQEAILNACIHSKSELVRVALVQRNDEVTIEVQDNGIGFEVSQNKEDRFGLHSIRERVRLLGKDLKIESQPGQGTRIEATFPLIYRKEEEE